MPFKNAHIHKEKIAPGFKAAKDPLTLPLGWQQATSTIQNISELVRDT